MTAISLAPRQRHWTQGPDASPRHSQIFLERTSKDGPGFPSRIQDCLGEASGPLWTTARTLALSAVLMFTVRLPSAHAAATAPTVVHSFNGYSEGAYPHTPLVLASDGTFYGAAGSGGSAPGTLGKGTVFKITASGTVTPLASFPATGSGGSGPNSLVLASDGNLYGTTTAGGAKGYGTVFKLTTSGTLTTLYTFTNGNDGGYPGGVIAGSDGNLYGTTGGGGASSFGTLFKITTSGTLTTLYSFKGSSDGATPQSAPTLGGDGDLYGTTSHGGATAGVGGAGTVYRATTGGTVTTLYAFTGGSDGAAPLGALVLAGDGNFYGTTSGSTNGSNHGTVFRVSTAGTLTTLHAFAGTADGDGPVGGLTQAGDGYLYGTTHTAGANSDGTLADGTLFSVSTGGAFATVATFSGGGTSLGASTPAAALTAGSDGNLYGTTVNGGASSGGTFIKVAISGAHPAFFSGETSLGSSIYYLTFLTGNSFGYYAYLSDAHYIYHFDLGYEYWFDAADNKSGIYFYDFASGTFFYTSPTFPFPYLYDFSLNSVLYYYPNTGSAGHYTTNPRYFYDFATGKVITK